MHNQETMMTNKIMSVCAQEREARSDSCSREFVGQGFLKFVSFPLRVWFRVKLRAYMDAERIRAAWHEARAQTRRVSTVNPKRIPLTPHPLSLRICCALLIPVLLLTSIPAQAWEATNFFGLNISGKGGAPDPRFANPEPVRTQTKVKVNTTPPNVIPPSAQPVFSGRRVTDEDIFRARVFEEPLVPVGGETTEAENQALSEAIQTYLKNGGGEDVDPILAFMHQYSSSPWRASLLTNLGIVYFRTGHYLKAVTVWKQAWEWTRNETDPRSVAVADCAVGNYCWLIARLGHIEEVDRVLKEIRTRDITGSAHEKVVCAIEALSFMKAQPENALRCGVNALELVRRSISMNGACHPKLMKAKATTEGMSLTQVEKLAGESGMKYEMAKREPGAPLIYPAVIHWKAGHYAALVGEENGLYRVKDSVFDGDFWVRRSTIDEEASGYFLVARQNLPSGWTSIDAKQGSQIFGKSGPATFDTGAYTQYDKKSRCEPPTTRMAQYNVHAQQINLNIFDSPVGYQPPLGPPVEFKVTYNQREILQPAIFPYSNLGQNWTFDWLTYLTDDPNTPSADVTQYAPGGGQLKYTGYDSPTQTYAAQLQTGAVLARTSSTSYEIRMPDGSKEVYDVPDGATAYPRKVFRTKVVDPFGNALTFIYDSKFRLVAATDAIGQVTTISYSQATDNLKITRVTDPFGRSAYFDYDSSGRLIKITDIVGITSQFTYGSSTFIDSMTTPYGTTTFKTYNVVDGSSNLRRWLDVTDPAGQREWFEFHDSAPQIGSQMSFHWTPEAMETVPGDYTKATQYTWVKAPSFKALSRYMRSEKELFENGVYFEYPGQSDPNQDAGITHAQPKKISRTLDDASSQAYQYEYNSLGKATKSTDPSGRVMAYVYDSNNVDLLEVRQQTGSDNDLLASFTYNTQHLPLTATDASGQKTRFTYNSKGQLTSICNAKNEMTTMAYNPSGYLAGITGPVSGSTTSFTYDGYGRVRTVTDSEGYTVTTDYDAMDRPTLITYPDGTTGQISYDKLDAAQTKDRLNRWSRTFYDALRRPITVQDAQGRMTDLEWCGCGGLEKITDALGHSTTWLRDARGRVTGKVYPDGKIVTYAFENTTSRLKSMTDARAQTANYQYFIDNNLKQVSYTNAVVATPMVSFTYGTNYNRVATMADGTGTTTYSYNAVVTGNVLGEGRLASIDGPLSNDTTTFSYDELGRVASRAINSVTNSVSYDSLGRVTSAMNSIGNFTYSYTNTTARLNQVVYPNGQTNTFDYFNNAGDQRLKQIHNKNSSGSTISKFDYEYNPEGQITKWTQQADAATPTVNTFEYDSADQLMAAVLKNQSTGALIKRYAFTYDNAGNRTSEQVDNGSTTAAYNSANQLTSLVSGGPLRFKGSLNEQGKVTVASKPANVDTNNVFIGSASMTVGTNVTSVIATDYSSNARTNNYQVVVAGGVNKTLTYDNNGNMTSDGTRTYEWDAADRLAKITQGTHTVDFTYDGLGRRVRILEKDSGVTQSDKRYLWVGTQIAEQRDSAGSTVNKRFEAQGVEDGGTDYFYTRDHLGDIREVVNSANSVQARYDYDPYGRRTKVSGGYDADFGCTGHFEYKAGWMVTDLVLTLYRAYDPELGRFISRDPIEEGSGLNLYAYVLNNSINFADPLGLQAMGSDENGVAYVRSPYTGRMMRVKDGKMIDELSSPGAEVAPRIILQSYLEFAAAELTGYALPAVFGRLFRTASIARAAEVSCSAQEIEVSAHALRKFPDAMKEPVAQAIKSDLANLGRVEAGQAVQRTIVVNGERVTYRAMGLQNGSVNVGTSFPGTAVRDISVP